ncbi:hypothetical protein P691DRAFT_785443 [Macrolepiota fuliginosa MF-IS2]|uniref:Uncharacterized protein n=1 Tax=Macrolepiota fuliginosa MF-IS2 TaxID=1400762 RepID=A0A9P5X6B1_9AGAR|nr:hypothetical protein P691DRAFT_785443 [Macrolepiota fuliginosa MF-IS2]
MALTHKHFIIAQIQNRVVVIQKVRVGHDKKHVPLNIRHILSAESAVNDDLAYPFLRSSLYLALEPNRRNDLVLVGWRHYTHAHWHHSLEDLSLSIQAVIHPPSAFEKSFSASEKEAAATTTAALPTGMKDQAEKTVNENDNSGYSSAESTGSSSLSSPNINL